MQNISTATAGTRNSAQIFERPVIILAAPRSGSTLLFETLSHCRSLWTIGDESHGIFESIPKLHPISNGSYTNRLTAANADPGTSETVRMKFLDNLRDRNDRPFAEVTPATVRLLEKTSKNSLRVLFLDAVFPDALFVYLHRDPRENISSIMEAWRSGGWVMYKNLPGWNGDWSMLLPPGWQNLSGKPLAEIAAFQWQAANTYILDDLKKIASKRWISISYTDLVQDPRSQVRRLCDFAGLSFDHHLAGITAKSLPLSRYTLTQPNEDKWRKNADDIERVLPGLKKLIRRISDLQASGTNRKVGRNEPCSCGSGKKYKRCHGGA